MSSFMTQPALGFLRHAWQALHGAIFNPWRKMVSTSAPASVAPSTSLFARIVLFSFFQHLFIFHETSLGALRIYTYSSDYETLNLSEFILHDFQLRDFWPFLLGRVDLGSFVQCRGNDDGIVVRKDISILAFQSPCGKYHCPS